MTNEILNIPTGIKQKHMHDGDGWGNDEDDFSDRLELWNLFDGAFFINTERS